MDAETDICKRFERQLAEIAALDHEYYINPDPTTKDRRDYYVRHQRLEEIRFRFYAELDAIRSQHLTISGAVGSCPSLSGR